MQRFFPDRLHRTPPHSTADPPPYTAGRRRREPFPAAARHTLPVAGTPSAKTAVLTSDVTHCNETTYGRVARRSGKALQLLRVCSTRRRPRTDYRLMPTACQPQRPPKNTGEIINHPQSIQRASQTLSGLSLIGYFLITFCLPAPCPSRYHTVKQGFLMAVVVASPPVRNPELET